MSDRRYNHIIPQLGSSLIHIRDGEVTVAEIVRWFADQGLVEGRDWGFHLSSGRFSGRAIAHVGTRSVIICEPDIAILFKLSYG